MAIDAGTLQVKTEIDLSGFLAGIRKIDDAGRDTTFKVKINAREVEREFEGMFRTIRRDSDRAGRRSGQEFSDSFGRNIDRGSSRAFDGLERGARQAGQDSGETFSRNFLQITERDLLSIRGGFFGRIGGEIASQTVLGFARGIRNSIRDSFETLFEFEARRTALFTLGVDQNKVAEQATDVNSALGTQISDLKALEVNYSLVSAGISDFERRSEALAQVIKLSVGGNADAAVAVELLTKAYSNFGAEFDVIADAVSSAVVQGQFELQDLAKAFPNVSQAAGRFGFTVQETAVLVAALSQDSKNASVGVTQVKNAIVQLEREGFRLTQGGLPELLRELQDLGPDKIRDLFGSQQNAFTALSTMAEDAESIIASLEQMNDQAGIADRNFEYLGGNLNNTFGTTGNLVESLRIELMQNLTPALIGIGGFVNTILESTRDSVDATNEHVTVAEQLGIFFAQSHGFAERLGESLSNFVRNGLEFANQKASELLGYLERNPDAIQNAAASVSELVGQIAAAAQQAAELLKFLAAIVQSLGAISRIRPQFNTEPVPQQTDSDGFLNVDDPSATRLQGDGNFNAVAEFQRRQQEAFAAVQQQTEEQVDQAANAITQALQNTPAPAPYVPTSFTPSSYTPSPSRSSAPSARSSRSGRPQLPASLQAGSETRSAQREGERALREAERQAERQAEINQRVRERATLQNELLEIDLQIARAEREKNTTLASNLQLDLDIVRAQQASSQALSNIVDDPLARAAVLRQQELEVAIAVEDSIGRTARLEEERAERQQQFVEQVRLAQERALEHQRELAEGVQQEIYGGFESITSGLVTGLAEGENAWERFQGVALGVLDNILQRVLLMPLQNAFFGGGGGLAAGFGAAAVPIPGFAGGVTNFSGGLAVVGERGPELVNLPRGADVIPNDKLGGMTQTIRFVDSDNNEVPTRRGSDGAFELEIDRLVTGVAKNPSSSLNRFLKQGGLGNRPIGR